MKSMRFLRIFILLCISALYTLEGSRVPDVIDFNLKPKTYFVKLQDANTRRYISQGIVDLVTDDDEDEALTFKLQVGVDGFCYLYDEDGDPVYLNKPKHYIGTDMVYDVGDKLSFIFDSATKSYLIANGAGKRSAWYHEGWFSSQDDNPYYFYDNNSDIMGTLKKEEASKWYIYIEMMSAN